MLGNLLKTIVLFQTLCLLLRSHLFQICEIEWLPAFLPLVLTNDMVHDLYMLLGLVLGYLGIRSVLTS